MTATKLQKVIDSTNTVLAFLEQESYQPRLQAMLRNLSNRVVERYALVEAYERGRADAIRETQRSTH